MSGLGQKAKIDVPQLPPFGVFEHEVEIKTGSLFDSYTDNLTLLVEDLKVEEQIEVRPFYAFRNFSYLLGSAVSAMLLIYLLVFVLHKSQVASKLTPVGKAKKPKS